MQIIPELKSYADSFTKALRIGSYDTFYVVIFDGQTGIMYKLSS